MGAHAVRDGRVPGTDRDATEAWLAVLSLHGDEDDPGEWYELGEWGDVGVGDGRGDGEDPVPSGGVPSGGGDAERRP